MHPDKFLGRDKQSSTPQISDQEKSERLNDLSLIIAEKRKEAVDARKESGIEDIWLRCEEAYLGIDDENRHKYADAKWAKPTSITGPLTRNTGARDDSKSTAFVRLTSRYVDSASAHVSEILLPIDDKAFEIDAIEDEDLVKQKDDLTQVMHAPTGTPLVKPVAAPAPVAGAAPTDPNAPPAPTTAPLTVGDIAQLKLAKAQEAAKLAETRIAEWMTEANFPGEMRKVVHDSPRIGVGVLKGPFPEIRKSKAITKIDSGIAIQIEQKIVPSLKWVDPWNVYPDAGCGEDIHSGDWFFEKDYISAKTLRALKKDIGYLSDKIDQVLLEGPGKIFEEGNAGNDKKKKNRYEIWYGYGTIKKEDFKLFDAPVDVDNDSDMVDVVVSMVNDTTIRAIPNPLNSGGFPYRVVPWTRRPGHWAGVGVGEQIDMPQSMVNASTRSLLNNAGVSAGPQIIIDQMGVVPANNSWVITPNKIWYKTAESTAQDVREAFFAVIIPSVQKEMMGIIEYAMKLAEEASGIPLITQGQTGDSSPQTFGQAELQDNNSKTWLRNIAYRFDDLITEPLVDDFYEWLLLDPEVPDEEKGDFKINAKGSIAMVERAIQETTMIGLMNQAANPAFMLDPAKLMAVNLKIKKINPDDVQYSKEDQEKMAAQPPAPPVQVMVEQTRGQNALQQIQAKSQADLQAEAQQMQQEQQMLQSGQATPHMASATARIEQEKIRAQSQQVIQASRADAELARAAKEQEIAQQNGQFDIQKMQLQRDLAMLQYAHQNNMQLNQVKAELAKTTIQEQTKRDLAAAELQLAQTEGGKDRAVDLHKHVTGLAHEQIQQQADRQQEQQMAEQQAQQPETA